ncbi:MAG: DedA family protein [Hyphomicrobiales bacterium]|nr:DedA family protein [Hyphomicrobiales bacterium]
MFAIHAHQILARYGYVAIFMLVAAESLGLPLPGEIVLVSAAILAGTAHALNIVAIITIVSLAAFVGSTIGYEIGRHFGLRLLLKHGDKIGMNSSRIKLGQYMFQRYGGLIVFLGRFVALLRAFAALLAGINRFAWPQFMGWNAAGAIVWATFYGLGGYYFGKSIDKVTGPLGIAALLLALIGFALVWRLFKRREADWQRAAEEAFPGPLVP